MEKDFDNIIKSSIKEDFDNISVPDKDEMLNIVKFKLNQRVKIIKIKMYISICAVVLVIPFIFLLYSYMQNVPSEDGTTKYAIINKTQEDSIKEAQLIIHGNVINVIDKLRTDIKVKEVLKGIYKDETIRVNLNDAAFEKGENVLLLLVKDISGANNYSIVGASQGKYILKNYDDETFVNFDLQEINLPQLKKFLNK